MPKLPSNLVKPPAFDNPLRRTSRPEPSEPEAIELPHDADSNETRSDGNPGGVVIPIAANVHADNRLDPELVAIVHRITVRIEDPIRCALEGESYRRRLAGEKTNVTEIARGILAQWASQRAK